MNEFMELSAAIPLMEAGDEWKSKNFSVIMAKDKTSMNCQGAKLLINSAILSEEGKIIKSLTST